MAIQGGPLPCALILYAPSQLACLLLLQCHFFTPPLTETPVTTPITTSFNQ